MEKCIDTVDVAREERRLLYVLKAEKFLSQTLKSHAPSAVRRHSVFKGLKIVRELLGIKAFHFDAIDEVLIFVSSLSASCDLNAAEEKIEALGKANILAVFHCVHRAFWHGVMGDEDKV